MKIALFSTKQWAYVWMICLCMACSQQTDSGNQNAPDTSEHSLPQSVILDLDQIQKRDTLRAILTYSSTSYFIYKGEPMGYEYELVSRLAEHLDVELEVVRATDLDHMNEMLLEGKGDLVAHGLTITNSRKEVVAFTESHYQTQQVLVQRKPTNWHQLKKHQIDRKLIRNPVDLIGKEIHVRQASAYYERLKHLSDEVGGEIHIQPIDGSLTTEEIIGMVANGEIEYTLADQNIAMINHSYLPDIDIETTVSYPQRLAWAMRKNSPQLLAAVNRWIQEMKDGTDYYVIYNKYYKNRRAFKTRKESDYFSLEGGQISPYDAYIRAGAEKLGWDWRLLAAQVYQESHFDPKNQSWAGAVGLMQLMPATGKQFGLTDPTDPEQNIRAGVAYLLYLQDYWKDIADPAARRHFILASYNAGPGHVEDARRLAEKYGGDPLIWDKQVSEYMLKKANPEFFHDEIVRYGYCRGSEPVRYVKEIYKRYRHYQKTIPLENKQNMAFNPAQWSTIGLAAL